jgi:hypothetical protein
MSVMSADASPGKSDGQRGHSQAKVTFGLALAVVVTLLSFAWFISSTLDERFISVSVIALGLSAGMIGGTALSPSNKNESRRFTSFGQAVAAFVGGYLASKLDPFINSVVARTRLRILGPWGYSGSWHLLRPCSPRAKPRSAAAATTAIEI